MNKLALLSAACGALLFQAAIAQNATTVPVGAMTIDFPATGASPATTTKYISIPLHDNAVFTGRPSSVTPDTLTFSGVSWTTTPSQFGASPSNHVLRVMSGQQAGRILQITSNTANSLTVSTTDRTLQTTALDYSGFAITTTDTVEVVPCDTLAGIFGDGSPGNSLLLLGSGSSFTADTVGIQDRASGLIVGYFYNSSAGQWRRGVNTANANATPIYPDDALIVVRRTNRPASQLMITGRVPSVAPLLKASPVRSYLTTFGVPVDVNLNGLVVSGAWTRSNSAFVADTFGTHNPATGQVIGYFQRLDGTWRNSASSAAPDVSNTVIPAGSGISMLERTNTQVGQSSFNRIPLPYSL